MTGVRPFMADCLNGEDRKHHLMRVFPLIGVSLEDRFYCIININNIVVLHN